MTAPPDPEELRSMVRGRACRKCGADEWRARKDNGYCWCVPCARAHKARYYADNSERIIASTSKYHANNREKVLAKMASFRAENPCKVRLNREKWHAENPGRARAQSAKCRAARPEIHRSHDAKRRALKLNATGRGVTAPQWRQVLVDSLGICAYCNERRPLTMDHIEPLALGGAHDIDNITAACKSCNCSKNDTPLLLWLAKKRLAREAA